MSELDKENIIYDFDKLIDHLKMRKQQLDESNIKLKCANDRYENCLKTYEACKNTFRIMYEKYDSMEDFHHCYDDNVTRIRNRFKNASDDLLMHEIELKRSKELNAKAKQSLKDILKDLSNMLIEDIKD